MAATTVGTVGSHGLSDETSNGIIIASIEETTRSEKLYQKNHIGQRTGRADFDDSIEFQIRGEQTASSPFSSKLSAELTLANTITTSSLNATGSGKTLIDEVQRGGEREGWKSVTVSGEVLPYFPTS